MIAIIGTSDRPCWLAEACKILLLLRRVLFPRPLAANRALIFGHCSLLHRSPVSSSGHNLRVAGCGFQITLKTPRQKSCQGRDSPAMTVPTLLAFFIFLLASAALHAYPVQCQAKPTVRKPLPVRTYCGGRVRQPALSASRF